jgi:hypothetical protein
VKRRRRSKIERVLLKVYNLLPGRKELRRLLLSHTLYEERSDGPTFVP